MAQLVARAGLILLLSLAAASRASIVHMDDAALRGMTPDELANVEAEIVKMKTEVEAETRSVRQRLIDMTRERDRLRAQAANLQGEAIWEADQKGKSERETIHAKKTVAEKRIVQARLNSTVAELSADVNDIKTQIAKTLADKQRSEAALSDPTIRQVLDRKVQTWGSAPRRLYNSTMDHIVPAARNSIRRNREIISKAKKVSPVLGALASAAVYSFWIAAGITLYYIFGRLKSTLTVAKLLFLGDLICASFWGLIIFFYTVLWTDPLVAMSSFNETTFFVFHSFIFIVYVLFGFIRVLVLAARMTFGAAFELATVVIAGHHYYIRIWIPLLHGGEAHASFPVYVFYFLVFGNFASGRLEAVTQITPEQLLDRLLDPQAVLDEIMFRISGARRRGDRRHRPPNRSDREYSSCTSDSDPDY